MCFSIFFFNDTATTEIYTLSLHDRSSDLDAEAPPTVYVHYLQRPLHAAQFSIVLRAQTDATSLIEAIDRKSTRLNSSHANISYAVFCLKKKQLTAQHQHATYTTPSLCFLS